MLPALVSQGLGAAAPLVFLVPGVGTRAAHLVMLGLILATLARLNVRGVRFGTGLVEGVTVAKLVPLLVFTGVGAFFIDRASIAWPGLPDRDALGRSVLLLIFAYSGVEVALAPSGEVKNTARTVPRAVFLALIVTTAFWTHTALVLLFASTNTFQSLAIIANVGLLMLYLLACAAALELARRDVRAGAPPVRAARRLVGPRRRRRAPAVDPVNGDPRGACADSRRARRRRARVSRPGEP